MKKVPAGIAIAIIEKRRLEIEKVTQLGEIDIEALTLHDLFDTLQLVCDCESVRQVSLESSPTEVPYLRALVQGNTYSTRSHI